MLDADGLIAFVTIAETGSVHSAAGRLNVSQPALSRRLQRLEDALHVQLFVRSGHRLTLSDQGARLLPEAQAHLNGLMTALSALSDEAHYGKATLAVGCVPSVSHSILPRVILDFMRKQPSARIKTFDHSAMDVPMLVAQGKADFGIGMLGINSVGLKEQFVGEDPLVLAVHSGHPLARQRAIPWKKLAGEPLIAAGSGSGVRSLLENVRNTIDVDLIWQHEVQHLKTAADLVAAGVAHAILPRLMFHGRADAGIKLVRLTDPPIVRRMGILTRPNKRLSGSADALRRLVISRMTAALNAAA